MQTDLGGVKESKLKSLADHMLDGYAYYKLILDEVGKPSDFLFLETNKSFEKSVGLRKEEIIGKSVTDIFTNIKKDSFDWIGVLGRVGLTKEPIKFEAYFSPLNRWLSISAFSDEIGYFSTISYDITEAKKQEERIKFLSETAMKYLDLPYAYIDSQLIADDIKRISGASIVALSIYNSQLNKLVTEAISGIEVYDKKIQRLLKKELIGREWDLNDAALALVMEKKLITLKNLNEVTAAQIPKKRARIIEGLLNLECFYVLGIYHNDQILGYIVFGVEKDQNLLDDKFVELLVSQLGTVILRKKAEEKLMQSEMNLQEVNEELKASFEQLTAAEEELRDNYDKLQLQEKAIQQSEMKWRFALEGSGDGVWEWNVQTKQISYSDKAMKMLGYDIDDENIKFEDTRDRVHPEDYILVYESLHKHFSGESEIYISEHRVKCKDGSYKWVLDRGKVMTWSEDHQPMLMVGNYLDIDERKAADEALKQQKKILEYFFKYSPDAIVYLDADSNILNINEKFTQLFGYTIDECRGKNLDKLVTDDSLFSEASAISQLAIANMDINFETYRKRKDGRLIPVSVRGGATIVDGKNTGFHGIYTDISQRLEAELALRESEEIYRSIVLAIPDILIRYSKDGIIIDVSSGDEEALVMPKYQMLGKSITQVLPLDICGLVKSAMEVALKTQMLQTVEYELNALKGLRDFEMRLVPRGRDEIIAIVRDITDRKSADEKIRYLSFHDKLTGLYNRAFFDEELNRLDCQRQLPISILIGDVNGLKLTNDVFGHLEGDYLLAKIAELLKASCRHEDIVARWGGDEFAIILPETDEADAMKMVNRIHKACEDFKNGPIQISISMGSSTKTHVDKNIRETIKEAEEQMYRHKLLESKSTRSNIISSLQKSLFERSHETEEHAQRMRETGLMLGRALMLRENELDELSLLSILHDIGKIAITDGILNKADKLDINEWEEMKRHPEIGYRIAESSQELFHIAEYILFHHEKWDGTGYPQGLKGEKIPKLSRILAIIDAYDVMTHSRPYKDPISHEEALEEIRRCAGTQFDPHMAEIFINMMENTHSRSGSE